MMLGVNDYLQFSASAFPLRLKNLLSERDLLVKSPVDRRPTSVDEAEFPSEPLSAVFDLACLP